MDPNDFNIFDPAPQAAAQPGFLDQPGARAALLSFGLQAMQPISAGQNALGHLGQAAGNAGESFTRTGDIARKEAKEGRDEAKLDSQLELANRKMGLQEKLAAQRMAGRGGGVAAAAPVPAAAPPGIVPPGSTAMPTDIAAGPPAMPMAKPPVSEFVQRFPKDWATLKQRAQNGSPAERSQAASALARLKTMVADPDTLDNLLAS